jgi:hypothetical protein
MEHNNNWFFFEGWKTKIAGFFPSWPEMHFIHLISQTSINHNRNMTKNDDPAGTSCYPSSMALAKGSGCLCLSVQGTAL